MMPSPVVVKSRKIVATLFAADIEIARHHFFKHVAVAHFGADDFASVCAEGFIEAEVAHHRRNQSAIA